jgi:hypothetical protein
MTISIGAGQIAKALNTNFQDAALGSVGNLTFAGKPGATPRAPGPGMFQRMGAKIESAIAYVKASPQQRADAQVVASARKMSADTGALLGALTGARGDTSAQGKAASALAGLLEHAAPLAAASKTGTDKLVLPALHRHLDQLSTEDLVALRGGPLGDPASREAVLQKLDPGQRASASKVMDQVATALDGQIAQRASKAPIAALGAAFTAAAAGVPAAGAAGPAAPVDAQAMDAALEQLRAGAGMLKPDGQTLRHFFAPAVERLSTGELNTLARGMSRSEPAGGPSSFDALRGATVNRGPNGVVAGGRKEALDALHGAVADEITKRLDTAVIEASTPLMVKLMDRSVAVSPDAIRSLENGLRTQAQALGAAHLGAAGADVVTGLLARALTDLPAPQLDRLLDAAGSPSLARAKDGIAGLPEPRQTDLRAAVDLAQGKHIARLQDRVADAQAELTTAVAARNNSAIAGKVSALDAAVKEVKAFGERMEMALDPVAQTAMQAAVGVARDAHIARLTVPVDTLRGELAAAVAQGDHGLATTKVLALAGASDKLRIFSESMGQPVAADTQAALRADVGRAVDLFRAPDNPTGPLSASSLGALSTREFGNLRQARGELGNYGLSFDSVAVKGQHEARTRESTARAERAGTQLLHSLADPQTTPAEVVRLVREFATETSGTLSKLKDLGEVVGIEDIAAFTASVSGRALAAFKAQAGDDASAQIAAILSGYEAHIGPLSDGLPLVRTAITDLLSDAGDSGDVGDPDSDAMTQTVGLIAAAGFLLPALRKELEAANPQGVGEPRESADTPTFSAAMQAAVAGEFGVRVDADISVATPVLSPEQREAISASLTAAPRGKGPVEMTVPVGGVPTTFQVDKQFFDDASDRTGISFSVAGRGTDGQPVRAQGLRAGMPGGEARAAAMGESLAALQQVAGPAMVPLTRYMTQQLTGGFQASLGAMQGDSPLRLPSGLAFVAGGAGGAHFDVERLPDGRLSATVTMAFSEINGGMGVTASGEASLAVLDPAKSHFEAQFSVFVSDDGTRFEMREPLHLRYGFAQVPTR